MRESIAKSKIREVFYQDCAATWLTQKQRAEGSVLILLGDEPREIQYLDKLGIARHSIHSVERVYNVFAKQLDWTRRGDLGISIFYGEMHKYLQSRLHSNQDFVLLNLDVEGSYLNQLDPAMTSVMLFCWRNPSTLLATYSTIGRDKQMLREGLFSLLVLLHLLPEETLAFFARSTARFQSINIDCSINMTLRDLFWIRSNFEHVLASGAMAWSTYRIFLDKYQQMTTTLWNKFLMAKPWPLRLNTLDRFTKTETIKLPKFKLSLLQQDLKHIFYQAHEPWSQRCWFARFQRSGEIDWQDWLSKTMALLINSPLIFGNRQGFLQQIKCPAIAPHLPKTVVWNESTLYTHFTPRPIAVTELISIGNINQTIEQLQKKRTKK